MPTAGELQQFHRTSITREKAHHGDNILSFENIITGCAVVGVCYLTASPVMNNHAREPRSYRGCGNEGA